MCYNDSKHKMCTCLLKRQAALRRNGMRLPESIASVNVDGIRYRLGCGVTEIGKLKFELKLENKAESFYSWVVYLENESDERSSRIRELMGLDILIPVSRAARLNTLRGDDCSIHSFYPESFDLNDGEVITRSPVGGRSSDTTAFPYFDVVDSEGNGFVCGIGWSGQWKLDAGREGDSIHLRAGFQDCDFILEPHEKVRSVRILIYFGSGGEDKLRQQFVRLHRKFYSPVPEFDNNTFLPVAAQCFDRYYWGNVPVNGQVSYFETEDAQLHIIDNAAKCRYINAHWVDACWFDGAFRTGVGNFNYAQGFTNSLKNIGARAHRKGMRFILWFEPVRAQAGTELDQRFGDDNTKIVGPHDTRGGLVNLGDPEVWQYQFEHISQIIEENGVDIYRQDFNISPLDYLKQLDSPDRIGIAQIRFVEGLYRLWDALLERFPGLMIDNCSSGGRLIDVETCMRALPLWRSDMACRPSPASMQNEVLMLSRYIPYHQGSSFDYSPYFLRSAATTAVSLELAFLDGVIDPVFEENSMRAVSNEIYVISEVGHVGDFNPDAIAGSLKDVLSLREYWNGDFTALTQPSDSRTAIAAYTLRLAQEDRGMIMVLRREEAPDSFTVRLPEINSDVKYELLLSDENLVESKMTVSGKQLADGFRVSINEAPGSLLIKYRPIEKQ